MEKINLTSNELDKIIKNNTEELKNNRGCFGVVLPYEKDLGLKIHVSLTKDGYFNKNAFEKYINSQEMISTKQIEYLASMQPKIKLTNLPKGIAYYEGKPIAIILKYFKNHQSLLELYKEHDSVVLDILDKTLYAIEELMYNAIYQIDIKESNFLYSNSEHKVEPIDIDGILINVGSYEPLYEQLIQSETLKMFTYILKQKIKDLENQKKISQESCEERISFLLKLKKEFTVYDSIHGFISEVKDMQLLEKKLK